MENKKLYYEVKNNEDLSATVDNLETAMILIEGDMESQTDYDGLQYTITPVMMTDKEYDELPEME